MKRKRPERWAERAFSRLWRCRHSPEAGNLEWVGAQVVAGKDSEWGQYDQSTFLTFLKSCNVHRLPGKICNFSQFKQNPINSY